MTPVGFTPKRSSWTTTGSQKDCWMQTTAVRPAFFYHGGNISQTPQLCWMIWSAEWRLIGLLPSRNPENHGMWRTWNLVLVFIIVLFKSGLLLCTLFVCLMPQNSFSKQLLFDLLRPSYSEYVEDSTHAWIGFWHWFLRSLPLWRWWKSTNRCWSETHWTYVFLLFCVWTIPPSPVRPTSGLSFGMLTRTSCRCWKLRSPQQMWNGWVSSCSHWRSTNPRIGGWSKKHVYIILYNNIIIDSPVLHYSYAMCMSM